MSNFEVIEINDLIKADYNPRFLSDEAFSELKNSVKKLGCIKPIIVNKNNNTIIAGHQRTKSLKAIGINKVHAFFVKNITKQDEVRFNQFHNLCEVAIKSIQPIIKININKSQKNNEFFIVKNEDINIINSGEMGAVIQELSNLINKYGNFANAIVNNKGDVVISAPYALAVKLLGKDLEAYKLNDSNIKFAKNAFSKDYGVFNYDNVPKETFAQGFAQKWRLRNNKKTGLKSKGSNSTLYKNCVIPNINKKMRILDFGAGNMDYSNYLSNQGYNMKAIEFYKRKKGCNVIDYNSVLKDFDEIKKDVIENGFYDVVVCDSVLNSVDSTEAELSVLKTLNIFCKSKGTIYWSGIPRLYAQNKNNLKTTSKQNTNLKFLDENGFSASFRNGRWFYQKYHTLKQIDNLNDNIISDSVKVIGATQKSSFQCYSLGEIKKLSNEEMFKALKFEFSLPLPNGNSYTIFNDNIDFFNLLIKLKNNDKI